MMEEIQSILKETSDLERIIARIATGKASPRDVLNVGITLSKTPMIQNSINISSSVLSKLVKQFSDTSEIT